MTTRDTPFCVTWFGKLPSVAAATATFLFALSSIGASAQSTPNYVGFWWKPSESGWGMSIQQQGARTYAVWFTYDTQSAPIWHALDCAFAGNTCAGDLYTATGTPLSQITGSANHVPSKSGTGSITVTSPNRLLLAYAIGAVTQTKTNLEPQNFTAADQVPACTLQTPTGTSFRAGLSNYTDHWWGGPNAAGWGVQISHQGNQVFAGWFSYNQQGTATWLTAQGSQDANNARRFTGSLYQVNPGIPFSIINGPIAQSSIASVGTFEFNFVDGERGTFTYSLPAFGIVARSLAIERFAIAGGAVNVCTVAGSSTTTPWTKYFGAHYTNTPNASGLTRNWAGGGLRYPGGNGSQYRPALSGATYVDEAASSFTSIALPLINTLLGDGKYAVLGAGPPGALFLDSMTTASGRDAYKKSIASRIDQIAALTNGRGWEKKIYFQFGNEISNSASTGFYGALCLWVTRNTPTPMANSDPVTISITK